MKPAIPPDLFRTSGLMALYYVIHGLTVWLGFGALSYLVLTSAAIPWVVKLPALIPLCVISGLGLFYLGTLGHEGFHGNMHEDRILSMLLGTVVSSVVPLFISVGYTVIHWQHHLFTNTDRDPDYALYGGCDTLVARTVRGPITVSARSLRNAASLLRGRLPQVSPPYPFTGRWPQVFAAVNLGCSALILLAYLGLAAHDLAAFLAWVVAPALVTSAYFGMSPFIEHAGTWLEEGENTRTCTSGFLTWLLMGYTYHSEHHLYPGVQTHKLIRVHRLLRSRGLLSERAAVETSALRLLGIGAFAPLAIRASPAQRPPSDGAPAPPGSSPPGAGPRRQLST